MHIKSNTFFLDLSENSEKIKLNKPNITSNIKDKFKSNNLLNFSKKCFTNTFFRNNPNNLKTILIKNNNDSSNSYFNNRSNSNIQKI